MSRHRTRAALPLLGILLLGTGRTATAQAVDTVLGTVVLAEARVGPPFRDTIRVDLRQHGQYRIAVWPPATTVRVIPVASHQAAAFAPVVRTGTGSQPSIIEVYPQSTGPHFVLVSGGGASDTVQLRFWGDSLGEAHSQQKREREWGIGVIVGAGYHTGYRTQATEPPPQASADYEVGVLFGSSGRLALELGATSDKRYPGATRVIYLFAEPRFRLGQWMLGNHAMTVELCARLAQGTQETISEDPGYLAVGGLMTYHLDHRAGARGWVAGLQLLEARLGNVTDQDDRTFTRLGLSLSWFP